MSLVSLKQLVCSVIFCAEIKVSKLIKTQTSKSSKLRKILRDFKVFEIFEEILRDKISR